MNWLIVDVGNSRLKWARWNGSRIEPEGAIEYRNHALPQLWEQCWDNRARPDRIIVASVAPPQVDSSLSEWCHSAWHIPAEFLRSNARTRGVSSAYREPTRLGIDRWAALIAAHHIFPEQAICIADCGTAATIDALDGNGQHLGGIILPGLKLMQASLPSGTAGIDAQKNPSRSESGLFGQDTGSAITLGSHYAITGAMEQAAGKLGKTTGSEVICIITGGDAGQLLPHLDSRWQHRPELVLEGARILADNNTTSNT